MHSFQCNISWMPLLLSCTHLTAFDSMTYLLSLTGFFAEDTKKEELSPARKADQKAVDSKLLANIKKTDFLKPYLNARFTLSNGQAPHTLKF
jgi:hypothetical protein